MNFFPSFRSHFGNWGSRLIGFSTNEQRERTPDFPWPTLRDEGFQDSAEKLQVLVTSWDSQVDSEPHNSTGNLNLRIQVSAVNKNHPKTKQRITLTSNQWLKPCLGQKHGGFLKKETCILTRWWLQPICKIFVKLDHFPKVRGENKKYLKSPPSSSIHIQSLTAKAPEKRCLENNFPIFQKKVLHVFDPLTFSPSSELWISLKHLRSWPAAGWKSG